MLTEKLLSLVRACRVFARRDRDVVGQVAVGDVSLQVDASRGRQIDVVDLDASASQGMIASQVRKRPDLIGFRTQLTIMALAWS